MSSIKVSRYRIIIKKYFFASWNAWFFVFVSFCTHFCVVTRNVRGERDKRRVAIWYKSTTLILGWKCNKFCCYGAFIWVKSSTNKKLWIFPKNYELFFTFQSPKLSLKILNILPFSNSFESMHESYNYPCLAVTFSK